MSASVAVVDLGSNSFHLVIARPTSSGFEIRLHEREQVGLAAGLDEDHRLGGAPLERALASLNRFGERIREFAPTRVRAVGTYTFRAATNRHDILAQAEKALGCSIDVLSGEDEARLIYLGVTYDMPQTRERRLVTDIGGGSTEIILGEGRRIHHLRSLPMGCVSYAQRFFVEGAISEDSMRRAKNSAVAEIQRSCSEFQEWQVVLGTSGTITSVESILRAEGWETDGITVAGVQRLWDRLIHFGHVGAISLRGMHYERADVIPAGIAILRALLECFRVSRMRTSDRALRQGLIADVLNL